MRLLIIEDEEDLAKALVRGFEKKGYIAEAAHDGREGYELYLLNEYDVIILDLNLPLIDGIDVLKIIREKDKFQRIIILSARTAVSHRLEGLDSGANDYLCKPFDFLELEARVRSLLRRKIFQQDTEIRINKILINTIAKKVSLTDGREIPFAPREYSILEYLVLNCCRIISAETLFEHIWGEKVNIFTDSVKVHISNIRKKLRDATGCEHIDTVRGFGYRIRSEEGDEKK